jgi:predicted 3-demethylubiquinone-9 3-methyltransferase (glyoxalase superfamily)
MNLKAIKTCLWFDHQAPEAAECYSSIFQNGKINNIVRNKSGNQLADDSILTVDFEIAGSKFIGLNGGPYFSLSPAISFYVDCESIEELDQLWNELSKDGTVLMELGQYPFSEKFGWLNDRFGVSWQINLSKSKQQITPFLLFVQNQHGNAKAAIDFYCKTFNNSNIDSIQYYGKDQGEPEGTVRHALFHLNRQPFMAIDSAEPHAFTFSEAISFCVYCKTQEEIDFFWDTLSQGGSESQCGWLKDQFGVSWQIIPECLGQLMTDPEKAKSVMEALLKMQKLDIEKLKQASEM